MSEQAMQHVEAVRRFNRFYTRRIGVLQEGLLRSPFSLSEARVLYEIAHRDEPTASQLGKDLGIDPGYLSRILRGFGGRGLVRTRPSPADGRQSLLSLTEKGRRTFAELNARSQAEVAELLHTLPPQGRSALVGAMETIEVLLGARAAGGSYVIRPPRPGDMGYVIHRHGALYAQEYGWDDRFEALVAKIVARFVDRYDEKRERCWIAEKDGAFAGCVFLVGRSKTVGQLRLMLVEPSARGLGIGQRLAEECVRFARQAGYKKMMLWTQSNLHAARHIYAKAGFRLVRKGRHHSFGHDLVEEIWEMPLRAK
jgi:DNA-binding MarR family transcriptional regulator/N-acetylglutamate synthase-like GNAT family acetyltransferase